MLCSINETLDSFPTAAMSLFSFAELLVVLGRCFVIYNVNFLIFQVRAHLINGRKTWDAMRGCGGGEVAIEHKYMHTNSITLANKNQ